MHKLNLFYEEPNPDRWIKFDRYPRKFIRNIFRGKTKIGGQMMVALELMSGLDKLGIPYRYNDYNYARRHPEELIGIIGKSHLVIERKFKNPIIFGASIFSHPLESVNLLTEHPNIKLILVPGEWMRKMFFPFYGEKVISWPVGIDTEKWHPKEHKTIEYDFLIYDKVRWDYDQLKQVLIDPIKKKLESIGLTYSIIKYGTYKPEDLQLALDKSKAVIFLCEHETQGIAYQQILSANIPILAWDEGEFWKDPSYYPERVVFKPVSSVPYWDNMCGVKFKSFNDFGESLKKFLEKYNNEQFSPRAYILGNLTLEKCAKAYFSIYSKLEKKIAKLEKSKLNK